MMDWGDVDNEPGDHIRLGAIGDTEDCVAEDDDVFLLIAPQSIVGYDITPYLQAHVDAAKGRPMVLINPRLGDVQSAGNVMSIRGRGGRMELFASFEEVFHFRLLYNKPAFFPIYGALRMAFGQDWDVYKRTGRRESEAYEFRKSFADRPGPPELTEVIWKS